MENFECVARECASCTVTQRFSSTSLTLTLLLFFFSSLLRCVLHFAIRQLCLIYLIYRELVSLSHLPVTLRVMSISGGFCKERKETKKKDDEKNVHKINAIPIPQKKRRFAPHTPNQLVQLILNLIDGHQNS